MGDFNITRCLKIKKGYPSSTAINRAFHNLLNEPEVIEINPTNKRFSWSNFRMNASLAKLDRCFVSMHGT